MKLRDANKAILDRWNAQWPTLRPLVGFVFDNEVGAEPESTANGWARVVVQEATSRQHTLGAKPARVWRRGGLIAIQIFAPGGAGGSAYAMELAEDARSIFEGETFGGVSTYAASVRQIGPDGPSGGRWYMVLVEVAFDFDDQK